MLLCAASSLSACQITQIMFIPKVMILFEAVIVIGCMCETDFMRDLLSVDQLYEVMEYE